MSSNYRDEIIFDDVNISSMFKKIYNLVCEDNDKINATLDALSKLVSDIKDPSEVLFISPTIKEFFDVSVKNKEVLVKLLGVVQKFISVEKGVAASESSVLSPDERKQLLNEINNLYNETQDISDKISVIETPITE